MEQEPRHPAGAGMKVSEFFAGTDCFQAILLHKLLTFHFPITFVTKGLKKGDGPSRRTSTGEKADGLKGSCGFSGHEGDQAVVEFLG
jgi:hypothetical protein